jgi:hypothetical protein
MAATSKAVATDTTELTISPEALAAMAKAMSEATLAATRRENDHPTPMNAIGIPMAKMPALTYKEVLYCGAPQKVDRLLPDEVRLFNEITAPGFYGPDKTWEVRVDTRTNILDIRIHGIHKREVRAEMPRSLVAILQTIVDEQNAVPA